MKVSDKQTGDIDQLSKPQGTKKKSGGTVRPTAEEFTDTKIESAKVKLSDKARDIKKIRDAVDSMPDVDEAKVAKYKSLIQQGKYKVDAEKVADKLVDEYAYGDVLSKD